jgi:hypothetical protein
MANEAMTINSTLADATTTIGGPALQSLAEQFAQLTSQLKQLQPVTVNATSPSQDGGSVGADIGHALLDVFTSGLGLSPVISGIASLFGGGGDSGAPPPLVKFALPPAINLSAGVSEANPGSAFGVDQSQGGVSRPVTTAAPTQITVQVHAMDSQSFLDHSGDIAAAVRQAMLESSVLNDVIREV